MAVALLRATSCTHTLYIIVKLDTMSAPASDPPPPPNPSGSASDTAKDGAAAPAVEGAAADGAAPTTTDAQSGGEDVRMEENQPKEDPLDDIPEGVISVSGQGHAS